MPHRPLIALEVFDAVSDKYHPALRDIYGDLLDRPAEMAQVCVDRFGADLISVRLEGTHPEFGTVTMGQLLATWVTHDLSHLAQIARVMAKFHKEAVGPWAAYLSVLKR